MEFRPWFVRSFVVVVFFMYLQYYYSTVQFCCTCKGDQVWYMCSKQIHEEDHGHKMGHEPRALHGELIHGHLKAAD